jgi:hypothetical protein
MSIPPETAMRTPAARLASLALLLLTVAAADRVEAAWPHDAGANLLVNADATSQDGMVACADGAGGAFVAWYDNRNGLADIFVQHILASGTLDPAFPAGGLAVVTESAGQTSPSIVPDGAGGIVVAWIDGRPFGLGGVYAQHVLPTGTVDPAWPVNGRGLAVGPGIGGSPKLVSDGAGGAIAVWMDFRGATLDIYAQRVLASGVVDPAWPVNGRLVCGAAGTQIWPVVVSDGQGGIIASWEDQRAGASDIYARRVFANGTPDPAWPVDGRAVCTAAGAQYGIASMSDGAGGAWFAWSDPRSGTDEVFVQRVTSASFNAWFTDGLNVCTAAGAQNGVLMTSDGAGNAIVTWYDARTGARDLYGMRVMAYGSVHPGWTANGVAISTAVGSQYATTLVPDGTGGAIVAWYGADGAAPDITAHHLRSTGSVDPQWPASGVVLCNAPGTQGSPIAIPDGNGGFVVVWTDFRFAGTADIYAQRVARTGELGAPEPAITGLDDVPNDQGGKLRLAWDASWLDWDSSPALVDHYRIYRSLPPNGAGVEASLAAVTDPHEHAFLAELASTTDYAWEQVATVDAQNAWFLTSYGATVSTLGDSTAAGNPTTAFLVAAVNAAGDRFWPSLPASGYSVDDLAPAAPAPFTGVYEDGATHLHWSPNDEADLAHYRLYRGDSPAFVPGPGNLVASPPDTGHVDAGAAGGYYKLSAVDVHGNESGFTLLAPGATADVGDTEPSRLTLAAPRPNPARARAALGFALPRAGHARLAIHDLAGREVRVLIDAPVAAGEHAAAWDLRDGSGRPVAGGLYFASLVTGDGRRTQRVVVAR